jgi:hypothetical protein
MTSPNGIASNGNSPKDLTPEQIQLEIARTRSAITEDLRALSERFNPQQLRESAREVMRDAREEATHLIQDAKQAAFGSLIGAKDRAVERVQTSVHQLGETTRHASVLTLGFLSRNSVMMSLLGVASGILVYALRRRAPRLPGQRSDHGQPAYSFEHYSVPLDEPPIRELEPDASSPFATRRPDQREPRAVADNRGVVIAATVLAGIGLGLMLPAGRAPRRALARAGERVWDGAQAAAYNARRRLGHHG